MAGTIIADTIEHSDSTSSATNQLAAKNAAQTFSAAQTFTAQSVHNGGIDCNGNADVAGSFNIDGQYKQVSEAVSALEIDLSTGNYFTKTISGNSTFTFANPPASGTVGSFTLKIVHSSGTITWPSSVKFPSDTAPTLTAGKTHVFVFQTVDGGSRYQGISAVDYVN
tara:strand:- start:2434 stop:2934 length:501 start_codon:yes stop_codon:yes gene_type:complete